MKNKYRNPWCKETIVPRAPFYENNAQKVYEYRGVSVYKLNDHHYDYVLADCCITQRAGFPKNDDEKNAVIDAYLDGETPVILELVVHINSHGGKAKSYEEENAQGSVK